VKGNQPSLMAEIARFFADPPPGLVDSTSAVDKGHDRVEERHAAVSRSISWLDGDRRFPGEFHFPCLAAIAKTENIVHQKGKTSIQTRFYVTS
jgi:hypothetical protein